MKQHLGIKHFIWLTGAPREFSEKVGDITDFHIDGSARFVDESTVMYNWINDQSDPAIPFFQKQLSELKESSTESGKPLTLVPLPIPESKLISIMNTTTSSQLKSLPSLGLYIHFYVVNTVVIVPVYGDVNDVKAKNIISEHHTDRKIIGIPAHVIYELGRMIHCVTLQQHAV